MEDIVIRGSGGLAREVAFLIERINLNKKRWNLLGYVDMGDVGKIKYGYKVLGDDSWFQTEKNINCVIAIGLPMVRYKVYKSLELYSLSYPNIIDPSAIIAKDATLGIGNIITGPSRISVNVRIGDFCLLNGNCSLGHRCV